MKKTILKCVAIATFALLLAFNVTTTISSTNFSLGGLKALANGTSGGGGDCSKCEPPDSQECYRIIRGNEVHIFYGVKSSCSI